jgi:cell division control protein 6
MGDIFGINNQDKQKNHSEVIENQEKLKISHTPDRLKFREETIQNIVHDTFEPALQGYEGEDVVLTGKPGTGKTAAVKYVQKKIRENYDTSELRSIYVNCKTNNSKQEVFKAIMESVDLSYKKGVGVGENVSKLFESYNDPEDEVLVIMLDEVDSLYKSRREYINDVIYTLKRPHENSDMFEFEGAINLICVSNDKQLFNYLERDVMDSCFAPETYEFLSYNEDEITAILMDRQDKAFRKQLVDESAMRKISEIVNDKFDGDIRAGIKILKKLPKYIGEVPNLESSKRNQKRLVTKATEDVKRSRIEQVLNGKDTHFLLVLSAMTQCFQRDQSRLKYIVDSYRTACEKAFLEKHGKDVTESDSDSRAKSRSFVRRKLEYLIDQSVVSKERRYDKPKNPFFYQPEVDLQILEEMINERLNRKGVKARFEKGRDQDKSDEDIDRLQSMVDQS